jgi:predicted transcriptional regulator
MQNYLYLKLFAYMKRSLKDSEQRFINELASLLTPWGLPPSSGRVYGYLLLCQAAVSVDDIAEALDLSRAGAWNAARHLERIGHVTRSGAPGSKRGLYVASENFGAPFVEQSVLFNKIGKLLHTCSSNIATGDTVKRLKDRADFWHAASDSTHAFIEQFATTRAAKSARVARTQTKRR